MDTWLQLPKVKHLFYFGILFLVLPIFCACQGENTIRIDGQPPVSPLINSDSAYKPFHHPYIIIPDSLLREKRYKKAEGLYKKAAKRFKSRENWEGIVYTLNQLAEIFLIDEQYKQAQIFLDSAWVIGTDRFDINSELLANTYYNIGRVHHKIGDTELALNAWLKSLDVKSVNYERIASTYSGIGYIYNYISYQFDSAKFYFNKEYKIRKTLIQRNDLDLAKNCYNLGSSYRALGDLPLAGIYADEALALAEVISPKPRTLIIDSQAMAGNIYFNQKEYHKAIAAYRMVVKDYEINRNYFRLAVMYDNWGTAISKLNLYEEAIGHYHKSIQINIRYNSNDHELSNTYMNLGWLHKKYEKYDSAMYYFNKSLSLEKNENGSNGGEVSTRLREIGDLFRIRKRSDSALTYYHSALTALTPSFKDKDPRSNPTLDQVKGITNEYYFRNLAMSIAGKASILKDRLPIDSFDFLIDSYLLTDSLIAEYRANLDQEQANLNASENFREIYEGAIACAYDLYLATDLTKYIDHALFFMEKSKSILLLETLKGMKAYEAMQIPGEIKAQEQRLKSGLAELYRKLNREKSRDIPEDNIANWKVRLKRLTQEKEDFREMLRKNYPEFHQLKYQDDYISLVQLRAYAEKEKTHFIEYFWGTKAVYVVAVNTLGDPFLIKINRSEKLDDHLNVFLEELSNPISMNAQQDHFRRFSESSFFLYTSLVQPVIKKLSPAMNDKLTVVRDGPLNFIPYEALIAQPNDHEGTDYRNLAYLVKVFTFGYHFSANLLLSGSKNKKIIKPKWLAMSYSDLKANTELNSRAAEEDELYGAAEEVKHVAAIMKGVSYMGQAATEGLFKEKARGFNVIHLAVHGLGSTKSAWHTKLLFKSSPEDSLNDGALYLHELYNIDINSRMVVLSACESGVGKDYLGEGLYSMARGFFSIGCPSVLMTLWQVDDERTSDIIIGFYEEMASGKKTDTALRNAKLKYLSDASRMKAHPFNWAAPVFMGNDLSFEMKRHRRLILPLVSGVLLIMVMIWLKKRNSAKQKG
ncbi:CHAT domain-containing protein [Fulvivirgaceae bacterium BMA10]|uniref:CHAT domain-containing protein n=1 Tax=Splendidivirga corallicola TaxID=3051826 RepID=A0ABT8KKW1_9BACT|nr:CHAT domain-containing protein [Fulvivirgaceae bacterium BMA10]